MPDIDKNSATECDVVEIFIEQECFEIITPELKVGAVTQETNVIIQLDELADRIWEDLAEDALEHLAEPIDAAISRSWLESQTLAEFGDMLLPKLPSGEWTVTAADQTVEEVV